MQVAANRDKRIGVVMDTPSVGIASAGMRAIDMAVVSASGYFKNLQTHEPKWQFRDLPDGSVQMHADVPFGLRNIIRMTCKEGLVDTQFDGRNETGCMLVVTVVPKI